MIRPVTIEQAREMVLACASPVGIDAVHVEAALDRVLAEDVLAAADAPPFDSSAMDGYAIAAGPPGRVLRIVGEARAGTPYPATLAAGGAIRISTGAAVPTGAEAIIRQEDVALRGEEAIETLLATPPGDNIRRAGEDLRAGQLVLPRGTLIGPAELAVAVGAGRASLSVRRRPRVAILVTGDELREPGEALGPGEIHDSNGPMLRALALRAGAELAGPGAGRAGPEAGRAGAVTGLAHQGPARIPDDPERTRAILGESLARCEMLIVSGGVSVGPHDHVKPALAALGVEERFWRVALRPGGPTWFGVADGKLVFGLPGNPVSAAVTFTLFARPALYALQARVAPSPPVSTAYLALPVPRNATRVQVIRVGLSQRDGRVLASPAGPQGSHITHSLVGADALALIPAGEGELAAGTQVRLEAAPG